MENELPRNEIKSVPSTSVLALYVYKIYLLVGESTNILVYKLNGSCHCINSLKVFAASAIHSIRAWKDCPVDQSPKILVWGQKSIAVIDLNLEKQTWQISTKEFNVEDWIVSATISQDGLHIILVTAHNSVQSYSIETSERNGRKTIPNIEPPTLKCQYKKQCSENSLLYCGHIAGDSWSSCLIFSGTVFGIIHVWAPSTDMDHLGRVFPLFSIKGPRGAIFSIAYNDDKKLISATSEDRSVRMWKIRFRDEELLRNSERPLTIQEDWQTCEVEPLFCSFGHSARVWRSLIMEEGSLLSCGEDATICHWSAAGSLLSSWVAHPSSSVWCLTASKDSLYSGGSDGAVKRWKHPTTPTEFNHCSDSTTILSLPWDSDSKGNRTRNFPRAIRLISSSMALMICDSGRVWVFRLSSDSEEEWEVVYEDPLLKGYVVCAVNEDASLLALGALRGTLIVLKVGSWHCIHKASLYPSKVQSLSFITESKLVACDGFGKIKVMNVIKELEEDSGVSLLLSEHELPPCRHRWVTAAAEVERGSQGEPYLVVGDPCGHLNLFSPKSVAPINSVRRLHGRDGVTSVQTHRDLILTTGRDAQICYSRISDGQIRVLQSLKHSSAAWLCGVSRLGSTLLLPTFSSNKLQIWDLGEETLISEIECGGGHRSWDIVFGMKRFGTCGKLVDTPHLDMASCEKTLTCAFLKDRVPVIWRTAAISPVHTLKDPTSGREIQSLEPLFVGGGGTFFAFGGEDTHLHIHLMHRGKLHRINSIKSHLSSVRCVTMILPLRGDSVPRAKEVHLLTCGGRAQLKIWRLALTTKAFNLIHNYNPSSSDHRENFYCENLLGDFLLCGELRSHMLRPDASVTWKSSSPAPLPETRYMDALALWVSEELALLVLASSDGFLRILTYSDGGEVELIHGQDCGSCIFRLCLIEEERCKYVAASTSSGKILIWNLEPIVDFVVKRSSGDPVDPSLTASFESDELLVERTSLTSVASIGEERGTSPHLVVGGDDGSVHLLSLRSVQGGKQGLKRDTLEVKAHVKAVYHSSKVSGLEWLKERRFCSVSVDQRLIIWSSENNVVPLTVHFCSVPDIHGLICSNVFRENAAVKDDNGDNETFCRIFVYGQGLQTFDISKNEYN